MLISGLDIIEDYINVTKEDELIRLINKNSWNNQLSRQTQHYGFRYDYKSRKLYDDVPKIPDWLKDIANIINFSECDQIIINKYEEGQGISSHIDHKQLFGNDIFVLSLGEDTKYIMKGIVGRTRVSETVSVNRRSLLHLRGEARYEWTHSLKMKKNTTTRYSITFRSVN